MKFTVSSLNPFGLLIEPRLPGTSIGELDVEKLRELFFQEHLLVLRGFGTFESSEDFSAYCERWGAISLWPFGKVLELIEQMNPADHIFDHNYVPLHWDGMYRPEVPEYQIFHCASAPQVDQGGRTTFSNTTTAFELAPARVRDLWARVTVAYERNMEFYQSKTIAPVVTKHPTRGFPVLRYCEPPRQDDTSFVNHPNIEINGISADETHEFRRSLHEALYAPANFYAHAWQTGDVVIADNHTLLHGREAFKSGASRYLRRVHVLGNPPLKNPHLVSYA